MNLTKEQIETIARAVHAATSASHDCDCPHRPYDERSEESKENMRWFVRVAMNFFFYQDVYIENIPKLIHLDFLEKWKAEGYVYGFKKDKKRKIHPLLVPYDQLPDSARLNYELLVGITKVMVEHFKKT